MTKAYLIYTGAIGLHGQPPNMLVPIRTDSKTYGPIRTWKSRGAANAFAQAYRKEHKNTITTVKVWRTRPPGKEVS